LPYVFLWDNWGKSDWEENQGEELFPVTNIRNTVTVKSDLWIKYRVGKARTNFDTLVQEKLDKEVRV
jgi:hypothetical protein